MVNIFVHESQDLEAMLYSYTVLGVYSKLFKIQQYVIW